MVIRLFGVLVALLALHVGWQLSAPLISNAMLEGKMKDLVKNRGLRGERELKRDILAFAREKDIDLPESQIHVQVDNYRVSIAAAYETDVSVFFINKHYRFYPASTPVASLEPRVQSSGARTR